MFSAIPDVEGSGLDPDGGYVDTLLCFVAPRALPAAQKSYDIETTISS